MRALAPRNLSAHAYEELRREILAGAIAPGLPIRQDAVAQRLGISKVPLREALTRLEQDGLVAGHARRGYVVGRLSAQEADEIFELRLQLEPDATVRGSSLADSGERAVASAAAQELAAEIAAGGVDAGALNRRFHAALIAPAGRPLTLQTLDRLHVLAERYVNAHLRLRGRPAAATEEHQAILQSWLEPDPDVLRRRVASHITRTRDELFAALGS